MDREEFLKALNEANEDSLLLESQARRFLYRDVETLVGEGFLHHTLILGQHSVTLRTLSPRTTLLLRARAQAGDLYRWTIASSIWLIDGCEVPPHLIPHVYRSWIKDLHVAYADILLSCANGLRNRFSRALRLVEAYCYEPYSRGLWRMLGKPCTGLEDANAVRRIWVAYNLSEDLNQQDIERWSHTQALVSALTSKGGKKLRNAVTRDQEREKERRQRVIEDAVNWVIRGDEEAQKVVVTIDGQDIEVKRVVSQRSTKDLLEEMDRVKSGEIDLHDALIAQYHKDVRREIQGRRDAVAEKIRAAQEAVEQAIDVGRPSLVGYTPEQLKELRPGMADRPRTTATIPGSQRVNHVYDRYIQPDLKPGQITVDRRVEEIGTQPKQADRPSLQEQIAKRNPRLHQGPPQKEQ